MDELYLDNIDEYVHDQDRIVTYKWLSLTLGVHVNTAKQMLYHYLDHKRKESSARLHATYLVSGKCEDGGQTSHKVSVVREEQLEDFKAKMSLVVSVHVYSVQKALLRDSGPLYGVDYDAVKDNLKSCGRYSAIRCAAAVPRSSPADPPQSRETRRASTPEPAAERPVANGDAGPASKPPAKPQKGIMGMFASKAAPRNQDGGKEVKSERREEAPAAEAPKNKAAAKPAAAAMTNFFGNQTARKPDKAVKEEGEEAAAAARSSSAPEEKREAAVEAAEDVKKDSRSKTKRTEDSDGEAEKMEKKKRRRIKKPEPDSSDEDVIPDSPPPPQTDARRPSPRKEAESVKPSSAGRQVSEPKTRKRRRVLKSRTFVDEEGCIVTEKGYESESYSEDEAPAAREPVTARTPATSRGKEEEKKSQRKTAAGASKGTKQASIMGFFHKK